MSGLLLSATDIDAFVTIALRWTGAGVVAAQPRNVRDVLTVTDATATEVGRRLWLANHNAVNFGGPSELCDPEVLCELLQDPGNLAVMPEYRFQPLPGSPAPETAIRRAHYYLYQTGGDYWEAWKWAGAAQPFEMLFTMAMEWVGRRLLGGRYVRESILRYGDDAINDDLYDDPGYDRSGWQLSDTDRDLFLRLA